MSATSLPTWIAASRARPRQPGGGTGYLPACPKPPTGSPSISLSLKNQDLRRGTSDVRYTNEKPVEFRNKQRGFRHDGGLGFSGQIVVIRVARLEDVHIAGATRGVNSLAERIPGKVINPASDGQRVDLFSGL